MSKYFENSILNKTRILFDEIDPEKTSVKPDPIIEPPKPPKEPKAPKEPFNGIDLKPVMEKIEQGFKELNDKLTHQTPPKKEKSYKIGDEFDLFPQEL